MAGRIKDSGQEGQLAPFPLQGAPINGPYLARQVAMAAPGLAPALRAGGGGASPALRGLVGDQQAFQLRDAVLDLQLAPLQALGFQVVVRVGGQLQDAFVQRAVFAAQSGDAFGDGAGIAGFHGRQAYTRAATRRRMPGLPSTAGSGGWAPVEWPA